MQLLSRLRLPHLRTLDLSSCWRVSDVGMAALASATPLMEKAILTRVWKLTDASLGRLATAWPQLATLVVGASTPGVTAAGGLLPLLRGCTRLAALRLSGCCMAAADWEAVLLACAEPAVARHLSVVEIVGSPTLTDAALVAFVASRQQQSREWVASEKTQVEPTEGDAGGQQDVARQAFPRVRVNACPLVEDADLQATAAAASITAASP
jgi:hypothetical protein